MYNLAPLHPIGDEKNTLAGKARGGMNADEQPSRAEPQLKLGGRGGCSRREDNDQLRKEESHGTLESSGSSVDDSNGHAPVVHASVAAAVADTAAPDYNGEDASSGEGANAMPREIPDETNTALLKHKAIQSVMQDESLNDLIVKEAAEHNKKIQDVVQGKIMNPGECWDSSVENGNVNVPPASSASAEEDRGGAHDAMITDMPDENDARCAEQCAMQKVPLGGPVQKKMQGIMTGESQYQISMPSSGSKRSLEFDDDCCVNVAAAVGQIEYEDTQSIISHSHDSLEIKEIDAAHIDSSEAIYGSWVVGETEEANDISLEADVSIGEALVLASPQDLGGGTERAWADDINSNKVFKASMGSFGDDSHDGCDSNWHAVVPCHVDEKRGEQCDGGINDGEETVTHQRQDIMTGESQHQNITPISESKRSLECDDARCDDAATIVGQIENDDPENIFHSHCSLNVKENDAVYVDSNLNDGKLDEANDISSEAGESSRAFEIGLESEEIGRAVYTHPDVDGNIGRTIYSSWIVGKTEEADGIILKADDRIDDECGDAVPTIAYAITEPFGGDSHDGCDANWLSVVPRDVDEGRGEQSDDGINDGEETTTPQHTMYHGQCTTKGEEQDTANNASTTTTSTKVTDVLDMIGIEVFKYLHPKDLLSFSLVSHHVHGEVSKGLIETCLRQVPLNFGYSGVDNCISVNHCHSYPKKGQLLDHLLDKIRTAELKLVGTEDLPTEGSLARAREALARKNGAKFVSINNDLPAHLSREFTYAGYHHERDNKTVSSSRCRDILSRMEMEGEAMSQHIPTVVWIEYLLAQKYVVAGTWFWSCRHRSLSFQGVEGKGVMISFPDGAAIKEIEICWTRLTHHYPAND